MSLVHQKKFRSVRRKKRRGFKGIRPQELNADTTCNQSIAGNLFRPVRSSSPDPDKLSEIEVTARSEFDDSISSEKLKNSSFAKLQDDCCDPDSGFKVMDTKLLLKSFESAFVCKNCLNKDTQIDIKVDHQKREGLAEKLSIECKHCKYTTPLSVSNRIGGKGGGALELNLRSVIASLSMGHAELERFCGIIGLPPPVSKRAYNELLKKIKDATVKYTEEVMVDAANRLKEIIEREEPSKIHIDDSGNKIADVGVTVDGTWQKRGHVSKIGVVFVMAIRTGEVLDYVVKSLSCHECRCHERDNKSTAEYKLWHENHMKSCEINHSGSSGEMEASGACELFLKSIETRGLRYTQFVGDGDSSSFGKVKQALENKFGDKYPVEKEECVGHVQKRLGTALREYKKQKKGVKLDDGKVPTGKGRLTEVVIDKMQNYYGLAIRNNSGNLEEMKKSIRAIYHHSIKCEGMSLLEQHQFCPKDKKSWCKFWQEKNFKDAKYSNESLLPPAFFKELQPIFERLCKDELLSRCLKGLTQNQNESLNSQLWTTRCPKTKYCGQRRVEIAVCQAVSVSNTGAASKGVLMKILGLKDLGSYTLRSFHKEDQSRIKNMNRKSSADYKLRRKQLRSEKKMKAKRKRSEKSYKAGDFGIEINPESKRKKQKIVQTQKVKEKLIGEEDIEVGVTFVDEQTVPIVVQGSQKL